MPGRLDCIALQLAAGRLDGALASLYGLGGIDFQKKRYLHLLKLCTDQLPGKDAYLISAPGRTELGGNHTDHNHGHVLAAAVDLDIVAAIAPLDGQEVILSSASGGLEIRVDLQNLTPKPVERGTSEALVRGVMAACVERGLPVHGYQGILDSTCLPGTGLSSSAAFSVLIGAACNCLFANGRLSANTLAHIAGEAENNFFGKPCGLMDQMSSAVGSILAIDFANPAQPRIDQIPASIEGTGFRLVVVTTGGSHGELIDEYATIPEEMREAASVLGQSVARGIRREDFFAGLPAIRMQAGDRAALRLLHFIEEDDRAKLQAQALRQGRFADFLNLVRQSGESSGMLLQNCTSCSSTRTRASCWLWLLPAGSARKLSAECMAADLLEPFRPIFRKMN